MLPRERRPKPRTPKECRHEDERSDEDRKKAREEFDKGLRQAYEQDFLSSYTSYLRDQYPAKIEQATIDQLLGGSRRQQ